MRAMFVFTSMRREILSYFKMADSRKRGRSADKEIKNKPSPKKSARIAVWKEEEVLALLSIMKEETILYNLDSAKTPKEKRSAYKHVAVKLEQKGTLCCLITCIYMIYIWNPESVVYVRLLYPLVFKF